MVGITDLSVLDFAFCLTFFNSSLRTLFYIMHLCYDNKIVGYRFFSALV